jgi:UDP-MurNAc hydroxylase
MKIEFISNASIIIELISGTTVLVDPWLYPTYHGSWYNFPPLSEKGRQHYLSCQPDYIHISHLHPDHLDAKTLAHYDLETPILIGKFTHPHLENRLSSLGFKNIILFELNQPTKFLDAEITIWGDFHAMESEWDDLVAYNMDTSLWIKDSDDASLFHVNDNVLTTAVAKQIVQKYGQPTVAIIPYSGASMYPHAFDIYTDQDKFDKKEELTKKTLKTLFLEVGEVLQPKYIVPAAGSYVMGGKLFEYNTYLHQATPDRVRQYWQENSTFDSQLFFMQEGDLIDTSSPEGVFKLNPNAPLRDFTEVDRNEYGKTLKDFQLDHERILIPDSFEIPWTRIFTKCRRNLWFRQKQLNIFPEVDISIRLKEKEIIIHSFDFALDLESDRDSVEESVDNSEERYQISFDIDWQLMMMVVLGATIWNNLEIGALLSVRRSPDRYHPTVHSLMSYFIL